MAFDEVKVIVVERNGIELEFREESSPNNDCISVAGISMPADVKVIGGSDIPYNLPGVEADIGSMYVRDNGDVYEKYGNNDDHWAIRANVSQWVILNKVKVPMFGQYVIHRRPLFVLGTLILGPGAEVRFDNIL